MRRVFLTGATGYVGKRFVADWDASRFGELTCLVRGEGPSSKGVISVVGDLANPSSYADALAGNDTVIHMAAVTGKARQRDYASVNVEGTGALVAAAESSGVRRFLFVSSIAAGFANQRYYHYARSKVDAEAFVRGSSLDWLIIRPTMILGAGAPVLKALAKLAGLPIVPVFGNGQAMVEPIAVQDVVRGLFKALELNEFNRKSWDLGGPERLTIEELMLRLRRVCHGKSARVLHLPAGLIAPALALAEKVMLPFLPFTAGQMESFMQDSVCRENALLSSLLQDAIGLDAMLESDAGV